MAGEFAKFYIRLGTLFDPKGLKAAETQIKGTKKSVGGLSSAVGKLGAMFAGGAAIYKMIGFAKSAWTAYARQEEVTAKLNQALRTQGIYSDALSKHFQQLASDIQKVTTIGDEDTLAMIQLALSMGVTTDRMEEATKGTIGLSKAYGVDLNSAMKMVALAQQGEYTMLARYIPQLRSLTDETQKAALIKRLLADGFQIATAEAKTSTGQVQQLSNAYGDLKEKVGAYIAGPGSGMITWLKEVVARMDDYLSSYIKVTGAYSKQINLFRDQIRMQKGMIETLKMSGKYTKEWVAEEEEKLASMKKGLAFMEAKAKKENDLELARVAKKVIAPPILDKKEIDQRAADDKRAADLISRAGLTQDEVSRIELEALADRLMARGDYESAIRILDNQNTVDAKKQAELRAANFASTLGTISTLTQDKNKEIAAIGKAAAITQASIDTYAAANKALASAPPPFNFVLAGLVVAAGLSNVARIASFKTGGGVEETGPAFLHKGEFVLKKPLVDAIKSGSTSRSASLSSNAVSSSGTTKSSVSITNNISISGSGKSEDDIGNLCHRLTEATRNGLRQAGEMANAITKVGTRKAGITGL